MLLPLSDLLAYVGRTSLRPCAHVTAQPAKSAMQLGPCKPQTQLAVLMVKQQQSPLQCLPLHALLLWIAVSTFSIILVFFFASIILVTWGSRQMGVETTPRSQPSRLHGVRANGDNWVWMPPPEANHQDTGRWTPGGIRRYAPPGLHTEEFCWFNYNRKTCGLIYKAFANGRGARSFLTSVPHAPDRWNLDRWEPSTILTAKRLRILHHTLSFAHVLLYCVRQAFQNTRCVSTHAGTHGCKKKARTDALASTHACTMCDWLNFVFSWFARVRQHTPGGIACAQKWAAFHAHGG
jgi:hypothetical protein